MKIDFHVHTRYSDDSLIEPKNLVAKSRKLGIIPAITDHSSIRCHAPMRALKADFIPGEEILTDKGDLIGLYLNEEIKKRTPFLEALDKIREQGGIAYLPHMYDYGRAGSHTSEGEAAKVDVIEVFNARCLNQKYNERAKSFAESHSLLQAAGTDSHFLFEFGSTYTELPDFDLNSPSSLIKALKSKNVKLVTKKAPIYARGTTTIIAKSRRLARRLGL
ncbi:PHP domain-containing protein [Candidatus Micrarchaeota archaeon]|nr:PHP domain-containing protein [Candidatus Micrarchaeota archaeon]